MSSGEERKERKGVKRSLSTMMASRDNNTFLSFNCNQSNNLLERPLRNASNFRTHHKEVSTNLKLAPQPQERVLLEILKETEYRRNGGTMSRLQHWNLYKGNK
jgi:hypothetical protein